MPAIPPPAFRRTIDRPCPSAPVMVVVSDTAVRLIIEDACRQMRLASIAVERIADIERWPVDQIVVTDLDHLTPWWRAVGAAKVIVLTANRSEAMAGLRQGATGWIQLPTTLAAVVGTLIAAGAGTSAGGELRAKSGFR